MDSWSSWQVFSLLCFITLISTTDCRIFSHVHARSVNGPGAQSFIDSLLKKYGTNKSMDLKQFEALLKELKVGSMQAKESGHGHHESESESSHGHHDKEEKGSDKCYSAEVLFKSFSIESNRLNQTSFERICPAILQQIESKSCESGKEDSGDESESKAKAWGFGFLSVTIISSASLLGAFIVPFMNKSFYKILLLFMVSLAVGVLSGSGIIHLIPHAFGFHAHDGELGYLWKCLVIIGGIYSFFFLEYVMRMIVRFKEQSTCDNHDENEMDNFTGDIPAAGIADVQLQLYKVNPNHHRAFHNHGVCINTPSPNVKICKNGSTSNGFPSEASSQNSKKSREKKKIAPVAWMILIGDALHNFIDGLAIGASYSSSRFIGVSTSLAIFCEELPHELGDFAVLLNAGLSYKAALGFNFLSACSCYLGLVIGLLLGYTTSAVTWIYALAGGLFVYIALVDMLPEACEMSANIGERSIRRNIKAFALQNFGILLGFAIMLILALYGETISVK